MKKVSYYNQGNIEVIDFINNHNVNFNIGNAIKYIVRCNHKGNKKLDIRKAITNLDYEIEHQNNPRSWVVDEIGIVAEDWGLEGNLYNAMLDIYSYMISGNARVLERAKEQLERELQ